MQINSEWEFMPIPVMPSSPGRMIGSVQDLKYLNLLCWSFLLIGFIFPLSMTIINTHRMPDVDFVEFYSWSHLLNEHQPQDLYNYELLQQECMKIHPKTGVYGPLPYPPFVALFFRPFSLLPFWFAYLLWVFISIALYAFGLKIILARIFPQVPLCRSLILCLALAYRPFIVDTAFNGQLAVIGFIALAVALWEDDMDQKFRSGLALSLCIYKPTLLVLLLPMLLVTRRFRALAGFATGAGSIVVVTTTFEGFGIWPAFFNSLFSFGKLSSGAQASSLRILGKYVDFTSFSLLLHGGRSWPVLLILIAVSLCAIVMLFRFWRDSPRKGKSFNRLLWAATITWTLLLNIYVPIYDSILVVLAVLATASAVASLRGTAIYKWLTLICILIFVTSWFAVDLASAIGVQLLTLLIAALGIVQFVGLNKLFITSIPARSLDQGISCE
jgi:hypothetical protein